jgi:CheY-like chemotaxis protein
VFDRVIEFAPRVPLEIAIIDDSEADLLLTERIFRQCKILNRLTFLKTEDECIDYFQDHPEPVLLFIDVRMAPVSGVEILRTLREKNLARRSVVIMLSGLTEIKAVNDAYQLGARTFLVKPLRTEDVLELLNLPLGSIIQVESTEEGHTLHWTHVPAS